MGIKLYKIISTDKSKSISKLVKTDSAEDLLNKIFELIDGDCVLDLHDEEHHKIISIGTFEKDRQDIRKNQDFVNAIKSVLAMIPDLNNTQ